MSNEEVKQLQQSVDKIENNVGILTQLVFKLQDTTDMLARTVSHILNTMATKDDLAGVNLNLQTQINDLSTDLRSFKQETQTNFDRVNEKIDDLYDTVMNHDHRIEKLETKVFM